MQKIIGIILLVAAVFLVMIIGKTTPANTLSSKPSETTVRQTNTNLSPGQTSVSGGSAGGGQGGTTSGGTTIYTSPSSQATPINQRAYISSASLSGYPQRYSRVLIYSRLKEGETVDITGWKLKSNKGTITIPQAIEVYDPNGFTPNSDIILKPGNYVELYSLTSPLNRNLRLNKCISYLGEIYNFQPIYLPANCPTFSSSEIRYLSGQCQSYIWSLGYCKTPDSSFYNTLPGSDAGNACREFLQNIGYGGCFRSHRGDADFLSNSWIVWLGQQDINLDSQHDFLRLYDTKGNLISEYNY